MNTDTQLRLAILRELSDCAPLMQAEDTLLDGVRLRIARPPLRVEFNAALKHLEGLQSIIAIRSDVDGAIKWRLTETGKSRLAEIG